MPTPVGSSINTLAFERGEDSRQFEKLMRNARSDTSGPTKTAMMTQSAFPQRIERVGSLPFPVGGNSRPKSQKSVDRAGFPGSPAVMTQTLGGKTMFKTMMITVLVAMTMISAVQSAMARELHLR